jgi:hypothetical protein
MLCVQIMGVINICGTGTHTSACWWTWSSILKMNFGKQRYLCRHLHICMSETWMILLTLADWAGVYLGWSKLWTASPLPRPLSPQVLPPGNKKPTIWERSRRKKGHLRPHAVVASHSAKRQPAAQNWNAVYPDNRVESKLTRKKWLSHFIFEILLRKMPLVI